METSYNLLDEPWLRVMDDNCRQFAVSLTDALINAHHYSALAGENKAQDIALLRLLVAVVHTVFYRVDETGAKAILQDPDDALDRWEALWRGGFLPEKPIRDYLEQWRSRFDLLSPERPFFQVPEAKKGTANTAAKLNGMILQSSNKDKVRIFKSCSQENSVSLNYDEAARWLVYLNAFDDTALKPKEEKGSIGVGWLGKLGVIYLTGNNLFETILPFSN